MNALTIHLHLRSALLITQLGGGDPNSGVGYNFIPGSTLRGALISRYLDGRQVDAADPTFRRLFLDGSVRFLHGYPLARSGVRMLPMPRSWQQPKDARATDPIYDWALGKPTTVTAKAWKSVSNAHFCLLSAGNRVAQHTPEMKINIHIAREDRQRPTSGSATIFRYDALAEGQTFAAVIVADDAADLARIRELLPDKGLLAMGRSRAAGYGWVEVRYPRVGSQLADQPVAPWSETGQLAEATTAAPAQLIVTLLSDALLQDPQTGAQCADLNSILGVDATASYSRLHTVGGFNRKWNLPMPQAAAIAAGSVFVYPYSAVLAQTLGGLVEQGVGSRRAEGFGRIAVNWQRYPTIEIAASLQAPRERPPVVAASRALAQQMVARMLRTELDRLLLQAINNNPLQRNGMRNTQLGRLRVVAQRALAGSHENAVPATQRLLAFLENLKESARNQLQRARVGNTPLLGWLKDLAQTPEAVWTILGATALTPPTLGDVRAQLTPELAVEYALRLIDGIAQLATREETND